MDYQEFLQSKQLAVPSTGIDIGDEYLHEQMKPFQDDLVRWSLRKGRAALFATTGMGKTLMQLVWGQHAAERTLILAPLAVARQTVSEGEKWGVPVTYARSQEQAAETGITITNYEMMDHFDSGQFGAVVLDESGILKSFEGKIRTALIEKFQNTPMRLCCTATPAPNDIAEIANHAEFLGIMNRTGMLATFFVHDDKGWRLKGHAQEPFYKWLASWGMTLNYPSDIGYDDDGYILPELTISPVIIPSEYVPEGQLIATTLKGVGHRAKVRQATIEQRIQEAAILINSNPNESWLAWVGLNDEGHELAKWVPDAVLVEGSQSPEYKADCLEKFAKGEIRVLISKCSIAGFGMNFQNCANMVFVGLSDSYEQYFQAIRRCWRFGQLKPVNVHIVLTDIEEPIYENVLRKEQEAQTMARELVKHVAQFERQELGQKTGGEFMYDRAEDAGEGWKIMLGDSSERLNEIADESIDMSVFSPPFGNLYSYSNTERDLGNSKDDGEFWGHFGFISMQLLRVMKPGRNVCVHVAQIPLMLGRDGVIGMKDFRGDTIRHFIENGFIYHGEICIDKDPQAQAIRTHSKGLMFVQLKKDSSWLRPALADYILLFRKPGDNVKPIVPDISNDEWIEFARPIWYGIRESETLNAAEGRDQKDDKHIAPLQLETIERCIRLWSNKGETVLSPFMGIGSEGYQAIKLGRRFVGCELKESYYNAAVKNLKRAEQIVNSQTLWAYMDESAS